ncbi:MAG: LptF/LptG family permease [Bacteroidales bacterium]|nr:LptF/LptG family permease [Bacteroidales bacterium]
MGRPTVYTVLQHYKIIDRYILWKYLKTFLLALALIIVIIITFDVSEKLDDFLHNHAPLKEIVLNYYMNFIPGFVNLYSPLFIFIAVIFFTSKMAGNTEIIAILGSGVSYKRMLRPYVFGSVIVAMVVALLGNFVIPVSNRTLIEFERQYVHTYAMNRNYFSNIHFQPNPQEQVFVESFDVKARTGYRFVIDSYDTSRRLKDRLTADVIRYDTATGLWEAQRYFRRHIDGDREKLEHRFVTDISLKLKPEDFHRVSTHIETMTTPQLNRHIEQERIRGSAGTVVLAKIELYQRLLNPLAIIIMTFIGVAISSRKTRGGIGLHLALGISIAFGYIVFMRVTEVFAINGNLQPLMAVLLPQLVFGLAAGLLVYKVPK